MVEWQHRAKHSFTSDSSWLESQIAVACGWICILNILTILALEFLNRECLIPCPSLHVLTIALQIEKPSERAHQVGGSMCRR